MSPATRAHRTTPERPPRAYQINIKSTASRWHARSPWQYLRDGTWIAELPDPNGSATPLGRRRPARPLVCCCSTSARTADARTAGARVSPACPHCHTIHPADAVRAVGRFEWRGHDQTGARP